MSDPGERPRWSFTWLLRIQRVGRPRRDPADKDDIRGSAGFRWFAWIVLLLLAIEVAVGVWLGVLPR